MTDSSPPDTLIPLVLIEDSGPIQAVLRDLIDGVGGYEVVARFGSETQATEWLQKNPGKWKLALVDLILFEGSGFNLINRARGDGSVLVVSDYAGPGVKRRCLELGASAVFSKGDGAGLAAYLEAFKGSEIRAIA